MSVNSKMTALADEIRALSGTTTTKSIDAMTSDVGAANTEISEQMDLITQITTALEGKAAGGSGVDLPDLSNPANAADILSGKEAIDEDGNKITGTIVTKTSSNLSASGATVTVPAGYYASQATKSVTTATQATPSVSIDSAGKITASATQTAGYVSAGTKTGTKQLTTQAAKTITPSTSSQTAVAKNVYTTGAVTVAAIPSTYVKPASTKSATTYTPTTSNQTITAGTYCSGTQTIKGDANLKAGNIKSGVSIFGVAGNYEGSGGSGGGSIKTCTIKIINELANNGNRITDFGYSFLDANNHLQSSGEIQYNNGESEIIWENVICSSLIFIMHNYSGGLLPCAAGEGGVSNLSYSGYLFAAPATENTVGIIRIFDDD